MKTNYNNFYSVYASFKKAIKAKLNNMRYRCENPQNLAYKYYGAKGIKVCSSWKNNAENFIGWCLENNYIPGKEIHRLNPHKDYEPENCVLCTKEEHIYYHQLINKNKKEFKESIRIHEAIKEMLSYYHNKKNS